MLLLILATLAITCVSEPPATAETCYELELQNPAGFWFCFDPANPLATNNFVPLAAAAAQCATIPDGLLTAQQVVLIPVQTTGSTALSWDAPVQNADGSTPLDDLDGYRVYKRLNSEPWNLDYDVTDPAVTTHISTGLEAGAWDFYVTAYDTSGNEGPASNVASKTVN